MLTSIKSQLGIFQVTYRNLQVLVNSYSIVQIQGFMNLCVLGTCTIDIISTFSLLYSTDMLVAMQMFFFGLAADALFMVVGVFGEASNVCTSSLEFCHNFRTLMRVSQGKSLIFSSIQTMYCEAYKVMVLNTNPVF